MLWKGRGAMKKSQKQSNLIKDSELLDASEYGVYDEQADVKIMLESEARVSKMTEEEREVLLKLYDEMVNKNKQEHK